MTTRFSTAFPLAALLLAAPPLAGCRSLEPPHPTEPLALDEAAALAEVNAFRGANGVPPLRAEPRLTAAAEAQSQAMAARDAMDHSVAGPLPQRVKGFGYRFSTAAENIAMGQPTFSAAMRGWEASPGHRRNLLDPEQTEIGLAAVRSQASGRLYWTQIFGRPMEGVPASGLTVAGLPVPSR